MSLSQYALIGFCAAFTTFVAGFPIRRLSIKLGMVDTPGKRSLHNNPIPTGGGLAMFIGMLVSLAIASQIKSFNEVFNNSSETLGVVIAAIVITGVGVIDDLFEVSPPAKVAGQVLAATILYFLGVTMFYFRIPFAGFFVLSADIAPLFGVIWVVLIANAINLIDGLDGLAAGTVAIAAGAFFVYGNRLEARGLLGPGNIGPLIAIVIAGICIGFLPHNLHPAKIFMGDTGALLLGILFAASTMVVGGRSDERVSGQTFFFFAPAVIPLVILGVPLLDSILAFVRRTVARESFSTPDKKHLHHRLMELGHGPRRSVAILWCWTALLSGFALVPVVFESTQSQTNALVPVVLGALAVGLYTILHPGVRRRQAMLNHPSSWQQPTKRRQLLGSIKPPKHSGSTQVLDITDDRRDQQERDLFDED